MSIDELDLDDEMGVEADEMVMPFNAVTLKEYKGGNIVRLLMAQRENGWTQGSISTRQPHWRRRRDNDWLFHDSAAGGVHSQPARGAGD